MVALDDDTAPAEAAPEYETPWAKAAAERTEHQEAPERSQALALLPAPATLVASTTSTLTWLRSVLPGLGRGQPA